MNSVRENLIAARALIDTPEKWSRHGGAYGRCYCVLTSLSCGLELSENTGYRDAADALCLAGSFGNTRGLIAFNDNPLTTHADIMALFDRAIAAQEA